MYLTYNDYYTMGGTLDIFAFNLIEPEAENLINWITFNRLKVDYSTQEQYTSIPQELKLCTFSLTKLIQTKQEALNGKAVSNGDTIGANAVARQENDGVSITYNVLGARQAVLLSDTEIRNTVKRYLYGLHNSLGYDVLYRGIYPGE